MSATARNRAGRSGKKTHRAPRPLNKFHHGLKRRANIGRGILPQRNGEDVTDTSLCCAPIINLWGAYWPAWVLCLVSGILLSLVSRFILSWTRLVPEVGSSRSAHRPRPRLILVRRFYPGLWPWIRDLALRQPVPG